MDRGVRREDPGRRRAKELGPLFLAEIASTCNEALLSDYLVGRAETKEQKAGILAAELGLDGRAVDLVLHALAASGVLERDADGRFSLPAWNAAVLLRDGADSQASIFAHHYHLMRRWVQLDVPLRTGQPVPREPSPRSLHFYSCALTPAGNRRDSPRYDCY